MSNSHLSLVPESEVEYETVDDYDNILIIGGSGSLGRALVRRLVTDDTYKKIVIYSRSEHLQESMAEEIKSDKIRYLIGDIRDKSRLSMAVDGNNIRTIINAAALKVVHKGEYDPIEFIKTNVNGVENVVQVAMRYGVTSVLQVSTDKAVYPINLYGATKLCAEKLIIAANNIQGEGGPRFGFVRYGNVSMSNGSVIPLFARQIAQGRPLTITHPEMTRFWITLPEAVTQVMSSIKMMEASDKRMFVPNMPAYSITDMAEALGGKGYPREVIGARPGEKLHERLLTHDEQIHHGGIAAASNLAWRMTIDAIRTKVKEVV
jgi:UDP-N-acetylglucosamine 4,6-dehydratase